MFKRLMVSSLFCALALPVWAEKSKVEIYSEPSGANIFLNGQLKGSTPQGKALVLELEEGSYKLEAKTDNTYAHAELSVSTETAPVHLALFRVPEMLEIPAGTFQMGSKDGGNDELPVQTLKMHGFHMSKYKITFDEYDVFVNATGYAKPNDKGWGRDKRPVIGVTWNDAVAYAEWLSEQTGKHYRLPTEAEWEYAARAGTTTKYWWGDTIGHNKANCGGCGSLWDYKKTAPVGSFPPNGFGLYETVGNVWEWTCSEYALYSEGKHLECSQETTGQRVARGGSWNYRPGGVRSAYRSYYDTVNKYPDLGFRLISMP